MGRSSDASFRDAPELAPGRVNFFSTLVRNSDFTEINAGMNLSSKLRNIPIGFEERVSCWFVHLDDGSWKGREWRLAVMFGFLAWTLSMFLYAPAIWTIIEPGRLEQSRAGDFLRLCANPLTRDLREPILAFRPVTPLLCWLLNLQGWAALALPYLFTIGALACICRAVASRISGASGALAAVAVALSWTVVWPNTKLGMPDGVTHFAVAVCLVSATPWLGAAMAFFGTLNDERFVLAVPFILLWHVWPVPSVGEAWRKGRALLAGFVAGMTAMLIVRHALAVGWIGPGISVPMSYTNAQRFRTDLSGWFRDEGVIYVANVLVAWRWLWLVWLGSLVVVWRHGGRWSAGLIGTGMAAVVLASSLVADVSRSIGFAFPAMLAIWVGAEKFEGFRIRRWLGWAVALCVVTPNFYLTDNIQ